MMRSNQRTQSICRQGVRSRHGLTLLEVLVSVAIFLGSLTAIMQLLNTGQQAEVSARLQSQAVLRCESKMAEIVAGIEKPVSSADGTFLDDEIGNWKWSADVANGTATSLLKITVTVEHTPDGKDPNAAFTLTRYMRDPQLFIDAALAATAVATENSSSGSSSSTGGTQ
jgi:general secretion pathway protein I